MRRRDKHVGHFNRYMVSVRPANERTRKPRSPLAVREERPVDPVGEGYVRGQQSDASGPDLFEGHEGGKGGLVGPSGGVGGGGDSESEGEEGGPGPPWNVSCSFVFPLSFPFLGVQFFFGGNGEERRGSNYARLYRAAVVEKMDI